MDKEKLIKISTDLISSILNINTYVYPVNAFNIYDTFSQIYYDQNILKSSLDQVSQALKSPEINRIYILQDYFSVNYSFLCMEDFFIIIGPYTQRHIKKYDILQLLSHLKMDNKTLDTLTSQYQGIPIWENTKAIIAMQTLLTNLSHDFHTYQHIELYIDNAKSISFNNEVHQEQEYIHLTHDLEKQFMESISYGNAVEAKRIIRLISNRAEENENEYYANKDGAHEGHAIARTLVRLAAKDKNIPSYALDAVTRADRFAASKAKDKSDLNKILFQTIDNVCTLILQYTIHQYSSSVRNAIEYIHSNLSSSLSVERIAKQVGVTPNYLSALFKKTLGIKLTEYISDTRLDSASRLLSSSELTVKEIAHHVGIHDYNYFSRLFKRKYGKTPSDFRNNRE